MSYDVLTDISNQFGQIRETLGNMAERLEAIEHHVEQHNAPVRQIVPVLQGTRTDIVEMRLTLLRLAGAIERALDQLPDEARQVGDPSPLLEEHTPEE